MHIGKRHLFVTRISHQLPSAGGDAQVHSGFTGGCERSATSNQQAADRKLCLGSSTLLKGTLLTVLAVIIMAACGGNQPEPAVDTVSTKATAAPEPTRALPEAVLPDGRRLTLELALTREEISQGLMFRNSLPEDRGMLFLFSEEHIPSFWMKNTLIPLDMVFFSAEGVIIDVIHNARPCTTDPCPQYVPKAQALAVLEVAAGVAEGHGLGEGIRLGFERVPGFPMTSREALP